MEVLRRQFDAQMDTVLEALQSKSPLLAVELAQLHLLLVNVSAVVRTVCTAVPPSSTEVARCAAVVDAVRTRLHALAKHTVDAELAAVTADLAAAQVALPDTEVLQWIKACCPHAAKYERVLVYLAAVSFEQLNALLEEGWDGLCASSAAKEDVALLLLLKQDLKELKRACRLHALLPYGGLHRLNLCGTKASAARAFAHALRACLDGTAVPAVSIVSFRLASLLPAADVDAPEHVQVHVTKDNHVVLECPLAGVRLAVPIFEVPATIERGLEWTVIGTPCIECVATASVDAGVACAKIGMRMPVKGIVPPGAIETYRGYYEPFQAGKMYLYASLADAVSAARKLQTSSGIDAKLFVSC